MSPSPTPRYSVSVEELIRRRRSVRTYSPRPVPREAADEIRSRVAALRGPFGGRTRYLLLDAPQTAEREKVQLGTYGWIMGASSYIAAASPTDRLSLLQIGFELEDAILHCTSLGLGTCWLAATFNRSAFSRAMNLQEDEILPVITPVGYPAAFRSPIDVIVKPISSIKARAGWRRLFFHGSFSESLTEEEAAGYRTPLEMVRLAPSATNRQPWRVVKQDGMLHFFLAHDPAYAHRRFDVQMIDMGIAALHFQAAAEERGLSGAWIERDPGLRDAPARAEYITSWVP